MYSYGNAIWRMKGCWSASIEPCRLVVFTFKRRSCNVQFCTYVTAGNTWSAWLRVITSCSWRLSEHQSSVCRMHRSFHSSRTDLNALDKFLQLIPWCVHSPAVSCALVASDEDHPSWNPLDAHLPAASGLLEITTIAFPGRVSGSESLIKLAFMAELCESF